MATFFAVFPDGIAWFNDRDGAADVVLFGQADPAPIHVDEVAERFNRIDNIRAATSLQDLGFVSAIDLLSSYAGRGPDLVEWVKGAAINRDRDLRLQYLAGMGVNAMVPDKIFSELMNARRIPVGLFVGSAESVAELHRAIESNKSDADSSSPEQR